MWWALAAPALGSQLAVDRLRDGLVVVTTWHQRPEIWWVPADGEPVRHALPLVATNPTVACGRASCDVGWVQPPGELLTARFSPAGPETPLSLGPATRAAFVADGRRTLVYRQQRARGERSWTWAVERGRLRRGALLDVEALATEVLPGLRVEGGQVGWRGLDGQPGGALPDGFGLSMLEGARIVPLTGEASLVVRSADGDAAVWTEGGALHAGWVEGDDVVRERVVEEVDPVRAESAWMELFVAATLADERDGTRPLTIAVEVRRDYTGTLTVTFGDAETRLAIGPVGAPATLVTTTQRESEQGPETWRWDRLVAALPALPGPCPTAGLELVLEIGPGDDRWRAELTERGALRWSGWADGPRPDAGDTLAGEIVCGGTAVPVRARWAVGAPVVTETLRRPKGLWPPM